MTATNLKEKIRVLILEDEDLLGDFYQKFLKKNGFDVQLHQKTQTLLSDHGSFAPDIAFLDQTLHGESRSGTDIIPILKKAHPDIKIVMLSNHSEFQIEKMAYEAGASDCLLKINTPPNLLVSYLQKIFV